MLDNILLDPGSEFTIHVTFDSWCHNEVGQTIMVNNQECIILESNNNMNVNDDGITSTYSFDIRVLTPKKDEVWRTNQSHDGDRIAQFNYEGTLLGYEEGTE